MELIPTDTTFPCETTTAPWALSTQDVRASSAAFRRNLRERALVSKVACDDMRSDLASISGIVVMTPLYPLVTTISMFTHFSGWADISHRVSCVDHNREGWS